MPLIRTLGTRALTMAVLVAALSGCFSDPVGGGPRQAGEMTATVVSPNGDEGSAILEVASGTIVAVGSTESYTQVYGVATAPARVVVVRLEPGEIALHLVAADVNHPPELRVVQVAGPDNALRTDLSGYSVRLSGGGS